MKLAYPLQPNETNTYSHFIKDYRRLTLNDKKILINKPKEFYKYVFWYLNLPYPTVSQLYMAKFLGSIAVDKDPKMLQMQRGLGKSLSCQIMVVWLLLRNKNEKIVVVSSTSTRAESFTKFCLQLIMTIPLLQHLTPTGSDRTSGKAFDVAGRTPDDSPSVKAFGVTGSKTGSRATMIVYDDPEDPLNSDTIGKREKLLAGVQDTLSLGVANTYRCICLSTPQSSESVYNYMVKHNGYKRTVIPAEYPKKIDVYGGDLAPHIARAVTRDKSLIGKATDKRCDEAHLAKQKVGQTQAYYKLHYLLDTTMTDEEKYPLKLRDMIVMDLDRVEAPVQIIYGTSRSNQLNINHKGFAGDNFFEPSYADLTKMAKYEGIAMFIDPAGRANSDETAYCVTAQLAGRIFILDLGGVKGGYDEEILVELVNIAKLYKVNEIQIESNFGDGSFAELLKPHSQRIYPVTITDIRATTNKFKRILETIEPPLQQHRLVFNKQIFIKDDKKQGDYSFTYQFTHCDLSGSMLKHDDIIDVLEMGVKFWTKSLARDTEKQYEEYKKKRVIEEYQNRLKEKKLRGTSSKPRQVLDCF